MQHSYFFGYGSLVNRRTHGYGDAAPAQLSGWRRIWRHTGLRPVAFLTVIPDASAEIDGLVARIDGTDWSALDERERAYDRVKAITIRHAIPQVEDVQVYTIPDGKHAAATEAHPVLLSYLDTVVQGFLDEFGEDGVARFFATTAGWDAPIADDRSRPLYPRHQVLTTRERALVDNHLADLACWIVEPPDLTPVRASDAPAKAASHRPSRVRADGR